MSLSVARTLFFAALLSAVTGCGLSFGDGVATQSGGGDPVALSCTSTDTGYAAPVDVYPVAPDFGATWWYYGQEPPEVATDQPYYDPSYGYGDPTYQDPASDPTVDPTAGQPTDPTQTDGTVASDGTNAPVPPDAGDPSLGTQSLHPKDFGGACYTCDLTCTLQSPDPSQPAAIRTAHGISAVSHGAACRDAEQTLQSYASSSYGLDLNACGYTNGG